MRAPAARRAPGSSGSGWASAPARSCRAVARQPAAGAARCRARPRARAARARRAVRGARSRGGRLALGVLRRAAAGAAVLFSSHQLELVERVCQRVVILERRRVLAAGTLRELRRRLPAQLRVKVDAPPGWARSLDGRADRARRRGGRPAGCRPRTPTDTTGMNKSPAHRRERGEGGRFCNLTISYAPLLRLRCDRA